MIPEEQQEQASLYALDLLTATEAAAFERALADNAELQALVAELRETAAAIAHVVPQRTPPPAVKARVLQQIAGETKDRKIVAFPRWIPWAIAAALAIFCGVLARDRAQLKERLAAEKAQPVLVTLAAAEGAPAKAEATVAWQPAKQAGIIKIRNLPAAGKGKDYQLWAVDAEHKDPIDAGILHVDENGVAQIEFKPSQQARQVQAFAISLERAGGVPKREGPILLLGKV